MSSASARSASARSAAHQLARTASGIAWIIRECLDALGECTTGPVPRGRKTLIGPPLHQRATFAYVAAEPRRDGRQHSLAHRRTAFPARPVDRNHRLNSHSRTMQSPERRGVNGGNCRTLGLGSGLDGLGGDFAILCQIRVPRWRRPMLTVYARLIEVSSGISPDFRPGLFPAASGAFYIFQ